MEDKKPLTREEEADEIIRRLSAPPKRKNRTLTPNWTVDFLTEINHTHGLDLEKEITEALSKEIQDEIDKEIMVTAAQWQKKNLFTPIFSDNHLVKAITLPSLIITPCIYVPSKSLVLK